MRSIFRGRRALAPAIAAVVGVVLALAACGHEPTGTSPVAFVPGVPLKDVVIPNLPSPYYHFEYDTTGRVSEASFASGLTDYEVDYAGGRIAEMKNVASGQERLVYTYDSQGRVSQVNYIDATGATYIHVFLTYVGETLVEMKRERRSSAGFVVNKTMTFTYYPDGNLETIADHRPAVDGLQTEGTTTTRFEQYDTKVNVDGFSLIHNDFFDHLVLLPGVTLQKHNPGREIVTGDGTNYTVNYTWAYDAKDRPLSKTGDVLFTSGSSAGSHFETRSDFSYYP